MQPGSIIGRFEVERPLGQGGMAMVYKVRHRQLDTVHALKLLKIGHPNLARRLLQEGRIQARLRHPNVVAVVDVVEHEGAIGLLMEYVQGSSLEDFLSEGPMEVDEALDVFRQVLSGVGAAHAAGVTHRDLKPANILLTAQGDHVVAKVTDFGIAKVLSEDEGVHRTRAGVAMGTPGYMAPEQVTDSAGVDHRADIFALGAILYEMLSGTAAFRGPDPLVTMNRTVAGTYLPLSERAAGLPPAVCRAVDRALSTDREARFADCSEMARAIYGDQAVAPAPQAPTVVPRPRAAPEINPTPTLAPSDTRHGTCVAEEGDDGPTSDTDVDDAAPPPSRLSEAWRREIATAAAPPPAEPTEAPTARPASAPRPDATIGAQADRAAPAEQDPEKPRKPDESSVNARDAADVMGDLFWTMVRATAWGMAKTLQYGGIPLLLGMVLAWLVGSQAARQLEELGTQRQQQALALHAAMDEGRALVPALVAAGANPALLATLQRQYEQAQTPEAKVAAARELSSVMTQQLATLPPPATPEEQQARKELEASLARLDREAARYGDLDRQYGQVQGGVGGKVAGLLRMAPNP
ncbi:serine/threonine protein kinase [Myxococcota bacterium]|nr:serine/threonine protein kinase [Myxococcota bacterium]